MVLSHPERLERRKQIAEYADRCGAKKAAGRYGVSMATVYNSMVEHGVKSEGAPATLMVCGMIQRGLTNKEIARTMDCSPQRIATVRSNARKVGLDLTPKGETDGTS